MKTIITFAALLVMLTFQSCNKSDYDCPSCGGGRGINGGYITQAQTPTFGSLYEGQVCTILTSVPAGCNTNYEVRCKALEVRITGFDTVNNTYTYETLGTVDIVIPDYYNGGDMVKTAIASVFFEHYKFVVVY